MKQNTTKPSAEKEENNDDMETDDAESDPDPEQEMASLNQQIDQLNSVLDLLEKKNDDIQAQLVELLKSNREIRAAQEPPQDKPSAS